LGRFPQALGRKGSKKWIQKLINEKPEMLNFEIIRKLNLPRKEKIHWLSPLKDDEYAEYRDQEFLERLGVGLEIVTLADFWPGGGPQWDGLGRSSSGNLFLVEAKSHIDEMISTMQAKSKESRKKICDSLEKTKQFLNARPEVEWSSVFYQYANRLSHLYLLKQLNQLPAYLVFVYFINDLEMKGPKTIDEWKGAIKLLRSYMGIRRHKLQNFITELFIDVSGL